MSIITYIKNLIEDAHKWQKVKIGKSNIDEIKTHWYSFSIAQILFIILSVLYVIFKENPFNADLIGYISAMFSIFVGLLLSLLILMFDKYQNFDFTTDGRSIRDAAYVRKLKRFFIQFNTLTTYSILIAILNIVFLLLCFIFDFFNEKVSFLSFINEIITNKCFDWKYLQNLVILLHRATAIYFVLDFFYLLIYSLTSIYSFINKEYNK